MDNNLLEFKIEKLSNDENELVKKAYIDYGDEIQLAQRAISLIWNYVLEIGDKAEIFAHFISQIQKSLHLALLSIIRRHQQQFFVGIRYVLESAVLACYALEKPNLDEFRKYDDNGVPYPSEPNEGKAYAWFDKHYEKFSEEIKDLKTRINKHYAHANIVLTANNTSQIDDKLKIDFFDKDDKEFTSVLIWLLCKVCRLLLRLFEKVVEDFHVVKLPEGHSEKVTQLENEINIKWGRFT